MTDKQLIDMYRDYIRLNYPEYEYHWPFISRFNFGYHVAYGYYDGWTIFIFKLTGDMGWSGETVFVNFDAQSIGFDVINETNKEIVRGRLEKCFSLGPCDGIVFENPQYDIMNELMLLSLRHAYALGVAHMKIFLSHKGCDKVMVRKFKDTLEYVGLEPWLDEDEMPAGTNLERGISQGFVDSCAAIFFITQNFVDERYLATEIDYAIREKRSKNDKFAIITLVFNDGDKEVTVPGLLRQYVWKRPSSDIEAFQEIIKALPIALGFLGWR